MKKEEIIFEGTNALLKGLDKEKRELIITMVSKLYRPRLVDRNMKFIRKVKRRTGCTTSEIKTWCNEVVIFFRDNLPKGYKRIPNTFDIVNKDGIILRWNRRKVKYNLNKKGYVTFTGSIDVKSGYTTHLVHRAVAITFIPNPYNKPQINHIDGNKQNNKVKNLEWVTNQENISHSWEIGLRNSNTYKSVGKGEGNSQSKLLKKDVIEIRQYMNDKIESLYKELSDILSISINELKIHLQNHTLDTVDFPMTERYVRTNARIPTYYKRLVRYDKSQSTTMFVTGKLISYKVKIKKELSKRFNISYITISDIISRRSWDYTDC